MPKENLKVIHRIFFGFGGEEDLYLPYLELWKKVLPEYEIRLWNAKNLPLDLNAWTRKMTQLQDGVFLSDFFRWWVCKEYGGIYLDADIEIYNAKAFNVLVEELENAKNYDCFIGVETPLGGYTSHSFASQKNAKLCEYMCRLYENLDSLSVARKKMLIGPHMTNLYFWEHQLGKNGILLPKTPSVYGNVKIYPIDYFSPVQYGSKPTLDFLSDNTCLAHHYGDSWVDDVSALSSQRDEMRKQLLCKRPKLLKDYLKEQSGLWFFIRKNARKMLRWFIHRVVIPRDTKRREYLRKMFYSMVEK